DTPRARAALSGIFGAALGAVAARGTGRLGADAREPGAALGRRSGGRLGRVRSWIRAQAHRAADLPLPARELLAPARGLDTGAWGSVRPRRDRGRASARRSAPALPDARHPARNR